eukprot:274971_1
MKHVQLNTEIHPLLNSCDERNEYRRLHRIREKLLCTFEQHQKGKKMQQDTLNESFMQINKLSCSARLGEETILDVKIQTDKSKDKEEKLHSQSSSWNSDAIESTSHSSNFPDGTKVTAELEEMDRFTSESVRTDSDDIMVRQLFDDELCTNIIAVAEFMTIGAVLVALLAYLFGCVMGATIGVFRFVVNKWNGKHFKSKCIQDMELLQLKKEALGFFFGDENYDTANQTLFNKQMLKREYHRLALSLFNKQILKREYHRLALMYHPDRTESTDADASQWLKMSSYYGLLIGIYEREHEDLSTQNVENSSDCASLAITFDQYQHYNHIKQIQVNHEEKMDDQMNITDEYLQQNHNAIISPIIIVVKQQTDDSKDGNEETLQSSEWNTDASSGKIESSCDSSTFSYELEEIDRFSSEL